MLPALLEFMPWLPSMIDCDLDVQDQQIPLPPDDEDAFDHGDFITAVENKTRTVTKWH